MKYRLDNKNNETVVIIRMRSWSSWNKGDSRELKIKKLLKRSN